MLSALRRAAAAAWEIFRHDSMPVRVAVFVVVALSGAAFLAGGLFHPQRDARAVAEQLQTARADARKFSARLSEQNDEVAQLRARAALRENTLASLQRRMGELQAENLRAREETLFFRRMFNNQAAENELAVYALDLRPDFAPQQWQLNAVLVRAGKKKSYKGGYFFEVRMSGGGEVEVSRLPAKTRPFEMGFYYEISETFPLPKGREIKNIRLTVVDKNEKVVASAELEQPPAAPAADGADGADG